MKNLINKLLLVFAMVCVFVSCTKNKIEPSRPTYWANIKIKGPVNQVVVQGSSYTDSGAIVTEAGVTIPYTTEGTVNTNVVGVYPITYYATNVDGIDASATKYVFVLPSTPAAGVDLSGKYVRAANNRNSTVTKILDGVYWKSDMWSTGLSSGQPYPVGAYFFTVDGVNLIVPAWPTAFGYDVVGTGTVTPTGLTFVIRLIGATGNVTRVWTKL